MLKGVSPWTIVMYASIMVVVIGFIWQANVFVARRQMTEAYIYGSVAVIVGVLWMTRAAISANKGR